MTEAGANAVREKAIARLGGALLFVALLATYSNHFQNSFHFDDAHTIVNNAAIRSVGNIPRFFTDATTFSSLPSNQSYRPLVSTLLATDYAIGGLKPFWFHLSIFALFIGLVFLVAFVIKRLLDEQTPARLNPIIALGAAALYGLHPANADTVNYIIASAEVISALGVVASFAVYLKFPKAREYYFYALPAAIAVLAKPTAAIFPVLFAVYWLLFSDETRKQRASAWLVVPPFVICGALLFFLQHMTPHTWVAGAPNARNYLITQPYVLLLYFKTFFWPSALSADYDLNPFTTTTDPRFWAGLVFVILFAMCAIAFSVSRKTRLIGFGLLWFLIALLPTSLFPLAEVMNDHRIFLPYVGLVIALAGAISVLVCRGSSLLPTGRQRLPLQSGELREHGSPKIILAYALALVILAIGTYATFQRNKVWKSEETLWHDVAMKSPRNGRGLMNYGNTLMAKGDYTGALDYFHRALALTPNYSVLFVNLAIAEDATKHSAEAEQHFKDALRLAPSSPDSYTFYARSLLSHSRIQESETLVRGALALSPSDTTARGLLEQIEHHQTRPAEAETAESLLNRSLSLYRGDRYEEAIAACQSALKLKPNYAEAWNNICAANNKLGRYEQAAAACEIALRLKPDFELARNNLQYARQRLNASRK